MTSPPSPADTSFSPANPLASTNPAMETPLSTTSSNRADATPKWNCTMKTDTIDCSGVIADAALKGHV